MFQKQIVIITGGPGFGKTQLINELSQFGYLCSGEFARDIIENQIQTGGDVLPWKNPRLFQELVLQKRIDFYESVPDETLAFADRGIPDQIAFAIYKGFKIPEILRQNALKYRYCQQVFVTPPWFEIYVNDSIRTESFEEAVKIHQRILETYADLNYRIFELPLFAVNARIEYILQTIQTYKYEH